MKTFHSSQIIKNEYIALHFSVWKILHGYSWKHGRWCFTTPILRAFVLHILIGARVVIAMASTEPSYAPFFGIMGATASMVFCGTLTFYGGSYFFSIRRSIWHRQVRCWNLLNGCNAPWAHYEVNHPCCYGGYRGYLWPCCVRRHFAAKRTV